MVAIRELETDTFAKPFSIDGYQRPELRIVAPEPSIPLRRRFIRDLKERGLAGTNDRLAVKYPGMTTGDIWMVSPVTPTDATGLNELLQSLINPDMGHVRFQSSFERDGRSPAPGRITIEEEVATLDILNGVTFYYQDGELQYKVTQLLEQCHAEIIGNSPINQVTEVALFPNRILALEAYGRMCQEAQKGRISVTDSEHVFASFRSLK